MTNIAGVGRDLSLANARREGGSISFARVERFRCQLGLDTRRAAEDHRQVPDSGQQANR